jgi:hypothetical protein
MSSTLYKEALLEVDELKRMAEENAKNKIIEAVTPQIRQLIESQLLGEKKVEDLDELDDFMSDDADSAGDTAELDMSIPVSAPPAPESDAAPKIKIDVQGDLNIDMETEDDDDDDDLIMGQQVSDMVEAYILGKRSPRIRINELSRKTRTLAALLERTNLSKASPAQKKIALVYYSKLLEEAVSLASSGIVIEESVDLGLLSQLKTTIKEIRHMANRRDAVAFRRLLEELEADEGLKEMMREEDEEGGEEAEAAEADVDAAAAGDAAEEIRDAADDLLAALGLDGEDDDDDDDDDMGGEEVEADEEVLELGEADDKDEAMHAEADDADEVYEIDEAMLRRELLRMREGLEAEDGDPSADESHVGDPMAAQEDFGGSDEVIEVSEEDLVEALHLEINRMRRQPRRRTATRRRRVAESRRRAARRPRRTARNSRIVEANTKLRNQLHEMNVFNAKLLFANKLMQNRDLTKKQQRAIVEALDSAKTVNEAKLLYKSLSASINQNATLSESKNRLLASSSRSTRSASPASNGVDGDRWAVLAGLSGKKI